MTAHTLHMRRAFDLAQMQNGRTGTNPSVGCVMLDRDGQKIGEAATGDGGRPHAEELALSRLPVGTAAGGTAYVTLEPCRERSGGSASCSQRLIDAGVSKIFIASRDPHPLGSGGMTRLREAGLQVEIGVLQAETDEFYKDFFDSVILADS